MDMVYNPFPQDAQPREWEMAMFESDTPAAAAPPADTTPVPTPSPAVAEPEPSPVAAAPAAPASVEPSPFAAPAAPASVEPSPVAAPAAPASVEPSPVAAPAAAASVEPSPVAAPAAPAQDLQACDWWNQVSTCDCWWNGSLFFNSAPSKHWTADTWFISGMSWADPSASTISGSTGNSRSSSGTCPRDHSYTTHHVLSQGNSIDSISCSSINWNTSSCSSTSCNSGSWSSISPNSCSSVSCNTTSWSSISPSSCSSIYHDLAYWRCKPSQGFARHWPSHVSRWCYLGHTFNFLERSTGEVRWQWNQTRIWKGEKTSWIWCVCCWSTLWNWGNGGGKGCLEVWGRVLWLTPVLCLGGSSWQHEKISRVATSGTGYGTCSQPNTSTCSTYSTCHSASCSTSSACHSASCCSSNPCPGNQWGCTSTCACHTCSTCPTSYTSCTSCLTTTALLVFSSTGPASSRQHTRKQEQWPSTVHAVLPQYQGTKLSKCSEGKIQSCNGRGRPTNKQDEGASIVQRVSEMQGRLDAVWHHGGTQPQPQHPQPWSVEMDHWDWYLALFNKVVFSDNHPTS